MFLKSLVSSFGAQFFSNRSLNYFLVVGLGIFVIYFLVQVKSNQKEILLSKFRFQPDSNVEKGFYSAAESAYRKKFNLLERPTEVAGEECNLDYVNTLKLQQDHPCVIKLIRLLYLNPPSSRDLPYNLTSPMVNHSHEKEGEAFKVLRNKTGGFFVECGAFDGLFLSNSLALERDQNWTGLLVEASPETYKKLIKRNRKSWTSNVCLSLAPYPTKISFTNPANASGITPALFRVVETDEKGQKIYDHKADKIFGIPNMATTEIQCFPLYSILLALNQTTVDYFALDIEGHEKRVLETIPFEKLDIKTMKIEAVHIPPDKKNSNGSDQLRELLEGESGYLNYKSLPPWDEFYIKNNL